jgi:hypothetical protein
VAVLRQSAFAGAMNRCEFKDAKADVGVHGTERSAVAGAQIVDRQHPGALESLGVEPESACSGMKEPEKNPVEAPRCLLL